MKKLHFTWKKKTRAYQTGEALYLNRIRIAEFQWNSSRSQSDIEAPDWEWHIDLPSLKDKEGGGHSEAEVRTKVEQIVNSWFKEAANGED